MKTVLAILLVLSSILTPAANSYASTITNQASCEAISGVWDVLTNTCTIDTTSSNNTSNISSNGNSTSLSDSTITNQASCEAISGVWDVLTNTCTIDTTSSNNTSNKASSDDEKKIVLADQASCEAISGVWDVLTNTCTVDSLNIQNKDTLEIKAGITLNIITALKNQHKLINKGILIISSTATFTNVDRFDNSGTLNNSGIVEINGANGVLDNSGTIINNGAMTISDSSTFSTAGHFENLGDFSNSGKAFTVGIINNESTMTIDTTGSLELSDGADLNNAGTITTVGYIEIGANLDNFNLINANGGSITITADGTLNNEGTVSYCDVVIEGIISGPGLVVSFCPGDNKPPTLFDLETFQAFEELPFDFTITASDPDFGQTLTYAISGEPVGMMIDSVTGMITWNPDETLGGTSFTFDIIVTDNGVPPLSSTDTVTILVQEVNVEPLLAPIAEPPQITQGNTMTFTVSATDSDLPQQNLAFGLIDAPEGATINSNTGEFSWTPSLLQSGTYTFDITVTDNGVPQLSDVETVSVTVIELNVPPVITPIPPPPATEDILFQYQVIATDTNMPAQILTYELASAPEGMTIDPATGLISWIPDETQGGTTQQFEVIVRDGCIMSLSDSEIFQVSVEEINLAPIIASVQPQIAESDVPYQYQIVASDPDIPANSLTYSISSTAPLGMTIDPATGLITFAPDISHVGTHTFDVTVTDDGSPSLSSSTLFEITVLRPVAAPVITSPADGSTLNTKFSTISGSATPDSTVKIFVDGTQIGTTLADLDGLWSFTPTTPISNGPHTITATSTIDGSTSKPSTPVNITIITTVTLSGIVRDFSSAHPDFEYVVANDPGIVKQTLGTDGEPVYAKKITTTTTGIENFNHWYNNVNSINDCTTHDITLTSLNDDFSLFSYSNSAFFPIDNMLLGNEENAHNYHFTYHVKAEFVYNPGQSITITGDDDIWVFIDGKLALDQGGVLPPRTGTINLDALGLAEGRTYSFDLFFAERHTVESNLGIETNIPFISVPVGQCKEIDATNDAITIIDGMPLTANVLLNDFGASSIKSVNSPIYGSVVISEGSIVYTPAPGFLGRDFFTYEAQNDAGATDTAVVAVEVLALKDFVIDKYIEKSSDDAEEGNRQRVDLKDNDLDLDEKDYVGLRFNNLDIPKGATITNAYIQFAVEDKRGDKGFSKVRLYAEDSDNAKTFTTAKGNISTRAKTSEFVDWTMPDWKRQNDAGQAQRTPNISSLIQSVVDKPGWQKDNSIVILVLKQTPDNDRDAHSFDGKKSLAPKLHIEYKMLIGS